MSIFSSIVSRDPITKGWSGDLKYKARSADGSTYFLRLSPIDKFQQRSLQFSHMQQVQALGVQMSEPVELGTCGEGCYTILSWIEGRDAEPVLPTLTPQERYGHGLTAGRMLRTIHAVPAPFETEPWAVRFGRKLDKKLESYENCPLKLEKGELFLELIRRERHLIENRPSVWHHGDYHCGNLMFDQSMRLTVIDFDREDIGDPWYEFNRIIWDVRADPEFACGMLDGYFDGKIPAEFWRLLRLYLCQNMISSLPWAMDFGETDIEIARDNAVGVLRWYDDLQETVPSWYHK